MKLGGQKRGALMHYINYGDQQEELCQLPLLYEEFPLLYFLGFVYGSSLDDMS